MRAFVTLKLNTQQLKNTVRRNNTDEDDEEKGYYQALQVRMQAHMLCVRACVRACVRVLCVLFCSVPFRLFGGVIVVQLQLTKLILSTLIVGIDTLEGRAAYMCMQVCVGRVQINTQRAP